LIDVNRLIEGENKISSIQDGTSHTMHFVDARSKKECTNEKVTGIWLEDLNFVQTPIEKVVSEHDPVAYINHLGQCEAWLMTMASVGAAGHGQVCLPNPEFSHLDIPMRHIQLAKSLGLPTLPLCATNGIDRVSDFLSGQAEQLRRVPFRRFAFKYRDQRYLSTESIIETDRMFALNWIRGAEMFTSWPKSWCWFRVAKLGKKTWTVRLTLKPEVESSHVTDLAFQAANEHLLIENANLTEAMSKGLEQLFDAAQLDYAIADIVQDLEAPEKWYFTCLSTKEKLRLFDLAGLKLTETLADWLETGNCPS